MKTKQLMAFVVLAILLWPVGAARAHKAELFVGYSNEQDSVQSGGPMHGYNLAGTWNFNSIVGLESNFAAHYLKTSTYTDTYHYPGVYTVYTNSITNNTFTYVIGPRLTYRIGQSKDFAAYVHLMVGEMRVHDSLTDTNSTSATNISGTGLAFVTGGGLDWHHGFWGIRILEADYVRASKFARTTEYSQATFVNSQSADGNFRISSGLILSWGKK